MVLHRSPDRSGDRRSVLPVPATSVFIFIFIRQARTEEPFPDFRIAFLISDRFSLLFFFFLSAHFLPASPSFAFTARLSFSFLAHFPLTSSLCSRPSLPSHPPQPPLPLSLPTASSSSVVSSVRLFCRSLLRHMVFHSTANPAALTAEDSIPLSLFFGSCFRPYPSFSFRSLSVPSPPFLRPLPFQDIFTRLRGGEKSVPKEPLRSGTIPWLA